MDLISLRPWTSEDLPSLLTYADNQKIARNLTNRFPHPYTEDDARWFIAFASDESDKLIRAIDLHGEAIGSIGLHLQNDVFFRNAELGYWLGEPFWGKGIATEAVRQMLKLGFDYYPFINRIFARPFGSNIGSQRLLEKSGFQFEARFEGTLDKHGVVEDELVYGFRRIAGAT